MNEQIKAIVDQARALLAAATPGPMSVGVGEVETEDAGRHCAVLIHTDAYCVAACGSPGEPHSHPDAEALAFAVNNIGTLCDALDGAERRVAEAEARDAHNRSEVERVIGPTLAAMKRAGIDSLPDATDELLRQLDTAEARIAELDTLHRVAEAREHRLERELLAVWATVRPGNPAPLTERDVLHAVEDVQSEAVSLRAIIADCAAAIGNGSSCTSRASVEFMAMIPAEIRAEVAALRVEVGKESALRAELADEVRRLRARVDAVGQVLAANGCDCDCECVAWEHDDDCDRCLACRVQGAVLGAATP